MSPTHPGRRLCGPWSSLQLAQCRLAFHALDPAAVLNEDVRWAGPDTIALLPQRGSPRECNACISWVMR